MDDQIHSLNAASYAEQEQQLDDMVEGVMQTLRVVNSKFLKKISRQIARIGELTPTDQQILVAMFLMNENPEYLVSTVAETLAKDNAVRIILTSMVKDIAELNNILNQAIAKATAEIYAIYQKVINNTVQSPRFAQAIQQQGVSLIAQERIKQYTKAVALQTNMSMVNLSRTTAMSTQYRQAIDKAVHAVATGTNDYKSEVRDVVRQVGRAGAQVVYPSGHHRRLDTAVRQNVTDGVKQISQQISTELGNDLGYDALELTAHMDSAPDHEPIQGRVFLKTEYAKLQAGADFEGLDGTQYKKIRRAIGQWNCRHFPQPFHSKYSMRIWTDDLLQKWYAKNHNGCTINGRHYTLYQATQLMRRIETLCRKEKDVAIMAQDTGDTELQAACQKNIDKYGILYDQVVKQSGMPSRKHRMEVPGFKRYTL